MNEYRRTSEPETIMNQRIKRAAGCLSALLLAACMHQPSQTASSSASHSSTSLPEWRNWDQRKAFEEAQTRVAQGKDPMPGPRSCFWRYGPSSGDPYLNAAFPDAGTFYWGAIFSMPKDTKLHLEGKFPHGRYMSFIGYDNNGAPIESVADYLIEPLPGSVNPYREGSPRNTQNRMYRFEIVNEPLKTPMRWGVYLKGETRDRIHIPARNENGQQSIQYRIYARDKGTDETGNAGLPEAVLTLADGKVLRGKEACAAMRTTQMSSASMSAIALPREELRKLVDAAKVRVGPSGPAELPPLWTKTAEDVSRFAVYTGQLVTEEGARRRDGSFYANQDNQYVRTFVSRRLGEVFVVRAKAPTTPKTFNNDPVWSHSGDLRYWSWCSNQGFGTGRVNACVYDEQVPTDANGNYTLVMSRYADRPRNAIKECGVAWLPMADVGDGSGETDLTLLSMRQMLGTGEYKEALHNIKDQRQIRAGMGPYFPNGRYMTIGAFETFFPCLLEGK
jgi:hypothetical protein